MPVCCRCAGEEQPAVSESRASRSGALPLRTGGETTQRRALHPRQHPVPLPRHPEGETCGCVYVSVCVCFFLRASMELCGCCVVNQSWCTSSSVACREIVH